MGSSIGFTFSDTTHKLTLGATLGAPTYETAGGSLHITTSTFIGHEALKLVQADADKPFINFKGSGTVSGEATWAEMVSSSENIAGGDKTGGGAADIGPKTGLSTSYGWNFHTMIMMELHGDSGTQSRDFWVCAYVQTTSVP